MRFLPGGPLAGEGGWWAVGEVSGTEGVLAAVGDDCSSSAADADVDIGAATAIGAAAAAAAAADVAAAAVAMYAFLQLDPGHWKAPANSCAEVELFSISATPYLSFQQLGLQDLQTACV